MDRHSGKEAHNQDDEGTIDRGRPSGRVERRVERCAYEKINEGEVEARE
jgi:hypothetical protein